MTSTYLALLSVVPIALFFLGQGLFFIWLERKISARIQDRLGPTRTGGRFGWLQSVSDGVKLLQKEDLVPGDADGILFRIAPYLAVLGAFLAFIPLPFGDGFVAQEIDVALFLVLAILSTEVFGVMLAGYGSGSKWSLFGGIRQAAQVVSYEVPLGITVIIPVLLTGTLSLTAIAGHQRDGIWDWLVFHNPFMPLVTLLFFVCGLASCKRAPFDLPEAESELVAGFLTEYSGVRWSFFMLAEYASMVLVSGVMVLLFLGAWHGPLPLCRWLGIEQTLPARLLGVGIFLFKITLVMLVMIWVRWSLPRLRIDQVMTTCLKYLLPIACFLLLATTLWEAFWPGLDGLIEWARTPWVGTRGWSGGPVR